MITTRSRFGPCLCLCLCLSLLGLAACAPKEPRSRLLGALSTLQSDASGSRKADACTEARAALAEYPLDAADRDELVARLAKLATRALREPLARGEARQTLVAIGIPSYEPLFDAILEADPETQDAARTCLLQMSVTAVPALIPTLVGDDLAARERATSILVALGKPIAPGLRSHYSSLLENFASQAWSDPSGQGAHLTRQGKDGVLAFAEVLRRIGDKDSVLALIRGAEALHRVHPEVATAHLRMIESLGPDAVNTLSALDRVNYDRLRLTLGLP